MKRLFPLVLLMLLPGISFSSAKPAPGFQLAILEMDESGVLLEFRLADFAMEVRQHDGVTYQEISVPGLHPMTEPGQPQLPGLSRLLGTPPGGVASIQVLESESEILENVRLIEMPAPTYADLETEFTQGSAAGSALYDGERFFPSQLAEVGLTGRLRDRPFAQLRMYPFRYNPVRQELQVLWRLRVQVRFAPTFDAGASTSSFDSDTPYDEILQRSLLNYGSLPPSGSPHPSDPALVHSTQNTSPTLKIFVDEDGLYRVTYEEIQNSGFGLSGVDPHKVRLASGGSEVAIQVYGEDDGSFDPGDWLEFFGTAIDSEFARRNVYWLSVGVSPGLRMPERDAAPTGGAPTADTFFTTLHLEENHEYWSLMPNGEGQDHWFWEEYPSAPHSSSYSFELQNIASGALDASVRVRLQGRTSTTVEPDHHTQIEFNGTLVDDAMWDGQIPITHEITVSQQLLNEGTNTLTVQVPGDTGASVDGVYFNWFEIGYWDTYTAENDQLWFSAPAPGTHTFDIGGFSNTAIGVYDISDPLHPSRLVSGTVESQNGTYHVQVEDVAGAGARYLALTDSGKRTPAGLLLDTPSSWESPLQGADYIIITHEDFTEAADRLADLRADQGLRVVTAEITDVYDEFSAGVFDPGAIRSFLSYAYNNWAPPAPLYVLLVGDANYDYQDYLGTGNQNFVPTAFFESASIGQTTTDNWYVSVSGDDPLPDMLLGRISVRTLSQANAVVDKIVAYEQDASPADWHQNAIFVTDDEAGFEANSDELVALLPANYTAQRIYASEFPQPYDPTSDIISAVDAGASIFNYTGHGHLAGWGSWPGGGIFGNSNIASLQNDPRYPFLVTGNCINGLFANPTDKDAFAEVFLNSEGKGGIGVWSPTGLGFPYWHQRMAEYLFEAFFGGGASGQFIHQLGAATTSAKIEGFAELGRVEPIEMFTLFGDPALALHIVQPGLSLAKTASAPYANPGDLLSYVLSFANSGNYPAENVILTEHYDENTSFVSASQTPTTGDNVWQIGTLAPGQAGTVTVTLQVSRTVPHGTTLINTAILSANDVPTRTATSQTVVEYFYRTYIPVLLEE
jgi:uncharacterized repeat protein (TIGR01451 family)